MFQLSMCGMSWNWLGERYAYVCEHARAYVHMCGCACRGHLCVFIVCIHEPMCTYTYSRMCVLWGCAHMCSHVCACILACVCCCMHVLVYRWVCVLGGCFLWWKGISQMSLRTEIQSLSLRANVPQDAAGDTGRAGSQCLASHVKDVGLFLEKLHVIAEVTQAVEWQKWDLYLKKGPSGCTTMLTNHKWISGPGFPPELQTKIYNCLLDLFHQALKAQSSSRQNHYFFQDYVVPLSSSPWRTAPSSNHYSKQEP